jgi:5-methylcytosine-specific restriction endonuclease McrA
MSRNTEEKRLAYNAYMRDYRKRPSQIAKNAARREAWILANPEKHQRSILCRSLKYRHGITPDKYSTKLLSQNGLCALCGQPFDNTELGRPVLDHDHKTLELREFLHRRCNLGIGNLQDDSRICLLAAEYLERHKLEGL